MKKIEWSEKVNNELVLVQYNRALLNNILSRKVNCIGHIVRLNCLVYDVIEGAMMEGKGIGIRST